MKTIKLIYKFILSLFRKNKTDFIEYTDSNGRKLIITKTNKKYHKSQ